MLLLTTACGDVSRALFLTRTRTCEGDGVGLSILTMESLAVLSSNATAFMMMFDLFDMMYG